jgi:anti-sigma B factor antagonist
MTCARVEIEEVLAMCDSAFSGSTPRVTGERQDDRRPAARNLLEISVTAGDAGPVVVLAGEADLNSLDRLNGALNEQIWAGARLVSVDLSRLRFADSATVGALVLAHRTLQDQGGRLELLRPQSAVARILSLTGVDQVLSVRGESGPQPQVT